MAWECWRSSGLCSSCHGIARGRAAHTCTRRFVIGTQESCPLGDWERLLDQHLGAEHVKVLERATTCQRPSSVPAEPVMLRWRWLQVAQESLMGISLLVHVRKQVGAVSSCCHARQQALQAVGECVLRPASRAPAPRAVRRACE